MPAISIIMPCHNRAYDLQRVLAAFDAQDNVAPFELVAIDDASDDTTYEILRSYQSVRYTLSAERFERNRGPAAARNRGIQLARSPLVLFVGDDILPEADLVRRHLEAHCRYPAPEVAILGRVTWPDDMPQNTLMRHIDGMGAQQFSYHYLQDGQEYDFRQLYTANVSLKKEVFQRVDHWFDTDFTYAAFEDAELAYRLSKHGLKIIYSSQPVGQHYHYHTVWTFATRQYRCGLMACVFAHKHPEASNFLRVTRTKYWIILVWLRRLENTAFRDTSAISQYLENHALHLASYYEWSSNHLLDELYLKVLEYFWHKGLIDGVFKSSANIVELRNAYAIYYLVPVLKAFIQRAMQEGVLLPIGYSAAFVNRLIQLESRLTNRLAKGWRAWGYSATSRWLNPERIT
jgi:glycosyltransferase involved in cell wall biosynthesis